jgi:hypothetical protein
MMGVPMYSSMRMGLGSMPILQNQFQNLHLDLVNGKGKGKAIDFDAAFAAVEKERIEALTSKLKQSRLTEVQGETPDKAEALESEFQRSVRPLPHACKNNPSSL